VPVGHSLRWLRVTFALLIAAPQVPRVLAAQKPVPAPAPCSATEYRQFDFFAGDWDTFDVSAPTKLVARNHVTPMVGGCALREVYEQGDGLRGESFSTYDVARHMWHQSWVTNRGALLLLDGKLEGDRMMLSATDRHADGSSSLIRAVWWREGAAVRERAERSRDSGKTWTPVFDIVFRRHR
jgi:hypothetical protein